MTSQSATFIRLFKAGNPIRFVWLVGLIIACAASCAWGKEPVLTAIELYDGASGATYIQLSGVLINGKAEMRGCPQCATAPIDKSAYGKLSKIALGPGGTLERGQDGVLRYTSSGTTVIVVPVNAKFEKQALSAADLADQAGLRGTAAAGGEAPPLGRGVTVVFVSAPDEELAEYLRARRAADIPGWQKYLAKYPTSGHVADAHTRLAGLLVVSGQGKLASYNKTAEATSPAYGELKAAKGLADQARSLSSSLPELAKLDTDIGSAQSGIVDKGKAELQAYRDALKSLGVGYVHLGAAKKYADTSEDIASTPMGQELESQVMGETNKVQGAIRNAESAVTTRQFDQAMVDIANYRSFADEEPRIAAVMEASYQFHLGKGKQAAGVPDWPVAIAEYTKAGAIKDTPEDRQLLADAREAFVVDQDKQAVTKALEESKEYEASKDVLRAYEVLDGLPLAQRKLVTDDLERLKPAYVQRSQQFAQELRRAHDPIRGPGDEAEIERAYTYLDRAFRLSQNEAYHDRMNLLGDELSNYLLEQAKHYLEKPAGSGTELGWTYLAEALPYKASNLDAVRDAMVGANTAHAIRSKLSIRVQFRDQTSQRDSAGFAGQLENAVIAGLEASKIPVKVVRAGEVTQVEPDYQLEGDVLHHHLTNVPVIEAVDSKYLAGTREVPSEDWNKINRDYEKAQMDLNTAQQTLEGAEAKGNKGAVKDLKKQVEAAEKQVQDMHALLDSTPKTITSDIIRTYSYTKKTFTLTASIQMQFRVADSFGSERAEMVPITREDQRKYVVLENVKPEDTEGVKELGTAIDPVEFLTSVENSGIESLIDAVRKRVEALPKKIYDQAQQLEAGGDLDGAGESFLHYLEISTPDDTSPEQKHAREFLQQQFNMRPIAAATP